MDKFSAMRAFVKVVEEGSFAGAARVMNLSRSQVNRAVINLEDILGTQLLHRTTRKVSLTATGQGFYERCNQILIDVEEAESEAMALQSSPKGVLRINAPLSFGALHLGDAICEFIEKYDEIRVSLTLNDRFIDPLEEGFDVTVRIAEPKEYSTLIDHEIIKIDRIMCAAPGYIQKNGAPEDPADLKEHSCLHYGTFTKGNSWNLIGPQGEKSINVNGPICSNNAEVLKSAALKGHGIALLPAFSIGDEIKTGLLEPVLCEYKPPSIYLTLLYPSFRHHSSSLRAFIEFMYDKFENHPDWSSILK